MHEIFAGSMATLDAEIVTKVGHRFYVERTLGFLQKQAMLPQCLGNLFHVLQVLQPGYAKHEYIIKTQEQTFR
jgi:hypothetical protein